jgi:hypothetical protein
MREWRSKKIRNYAIPFLLSLFLSSIEYQTKEKMPIQFCTSLVSTSSHRQKTNNEVANYLSIQGLDGTRGLLTRSVSNKSKPSGSTSFTIHNDSCCNKIRLNSIKPRLKRQNTSKKGNQEISTLATTAQRHRYTQPQANTTYFG